MSEGPAGDEDLATESPVEPEVRVNIAKRVLMLATNIVLFGVAIVMIVVSIQLWMSGRSNASQSPGTPATPTVPLTPTATWGASAQKPTVVATLTPRATVAVQRTATPTATAPTPTAIPVVRTPTPTPVDQG